MIQATPFDLYLFLLQDISPGIDRYNYYELTLNRFLWCRSCFLDINNRLEQNPSTRTCCLKLPMTENLSHQISDSPSWELAKQDGRVRLLRTSASAFLIGRNSSGGSPVLHLEEDGEFFYGVESIDDLFPGIPDQNVKQYWMESFGICAFQRAFEIGQGDIADIIGCWVVCPGRNELGVEILVNSQNIHDQDISLDVTIEILFDDNNIVPGQELELRSWELLTRKSLWGDERLPFLGPRGDFGFRPHPANNWQPGTNITQTRINGERGYLDEFGGLWQWEGRRAQTVGIFDGHWNVQLINQQSSNQWLNHLEEIYKCEIRLESDHINIETDGRIVDRTFQILEL